MTELNHAWIAHFRRESASWAREVRKHARTHPSWSGLSDSARKLVRATDPCLKMAEAVLPKSPKDWFPEKRKTRRGRRP